MSRRPASITQAEIARIVRAAKQAGAAEIIVQVGQTPVLIRLTPSTETNVPLVPAEEIVL